jgi:hypothetical protein
MKFGDTAALGGFGGDIIDDTSAHAGGPWCGILALQDTVVASLTSKNVTKNGAVLADNNGANTSTSITIKAGIFVPMNITGITLTSGGVYLPKIPVYDVPAAVIPASS